MPLDPTPTPSTPPPAAPAAPVAAQPSDAPPPTQPKPPATPDASAPVTLRPEEFQALLDSQKRLNELESAQRQREEAAQAEQARLLAAKGQVEEALKAIQTQSEAKLRAETESRARVEARAKKYALENEISKGLAMHSLLPGTAEQLAMILQGQLQAQEEGEKYVVRTPTFVSASDHIAQTLARPDYAHFLRPHGAGGTAGSGASQSSPTPAANTPPPPEPKNFGEAIILQVQEASKQNATVDPRVNMGHSFGLPKSKAVPKTA